MPPPNADATTVTPAPLDARAVSVRERAASHARQFWTAFRTEVRRGDLLLRASALAYSTIASLVPVIAIVLAILSGPAFLEQRERVLDALAGGLVPSESGAPGGFLLDPDSPQERFKQTFRGEIEKLANKLGTVSVFGFVVLLATAGMLFNGVERTFNAIWDVKRQRSFFMRVALATSVIFWGPVMLAVSVALTELLHALPLVGTYILPTVFTTLAFTGFYMVLPNSPVKFWSALTAGAAAALLWELAKLFFLLYCTHVVSYSRVYGSLGLIPMLFLWVYISWVLVLLGAELCYCLQHRDALLERYAEERRLADAGVRRSSAVPPSVVLGVAIETVRRFREHGGAGVSVAELASALEVERDAARAAAERLCEARVLVPLAGSPEDSPDQQRYVPASDPSSCALPAVLTVACDERGAEGGGPALRRARELLQQLAAQRDGSQGALTLADLAK